jgi:hypothetical protein
VEGLITIFGQATISIADRTECRVAFGPSGRNGGVGHFMPYQRALAQYREVWRALVVVCHRALTENCRNSGELQRIMGHGTKEPIVLVRQCSCRSRMQIRRRIIVTREGKSQGGIMDHRCHFHPVPGGPTFSPPLNMCSTKDFQKDRGLSRSRTTAVPLVPAYHCPAIPSICASSIICWRLLEAFDSRLDSSCEKGGSHPVARSIETFRTFRSRIKFVSRRLTVAMLNVLNELLDCLRIPLHHWQTIEYRPA